MRQLLFKAIEGWAKWLVKNGKPQAIANTAWAFATLGIDAPNLFHAIEGRAKWLVQNGKPQAVANTVWAFATLGIDAPIFFKAIEGRAKWLAQNGKPQAVANTACAFATLGIDAPNLFAEIESHAEQLVKGETSQGVANLAWAFAVVGYSSPLLFLQLKKRSNWFVAEANAQSICTTCYAIAIQGQCKVMEETMSGLWTRSVELFLSGGEFGDEGLCQLGQTRLFAHAAHVATLSDLPKAMEIEVLAAMERPEDDNRIFKGSKDLSRLLTELGFQHEQEVSPSVAVSGGMLAIDFACTERKISIEFDGPSHYLKALETRELTTTENGKTKAKRQWLEQSGWTVINIDYREHMKAKREKNVKQWLADKLKGAGVLL